MCAFTFNLRCYSLEKPDRRIFDVALERLGLAAPGAGKGGGRAFYICVFPV
jgi:FMN phosphatase YigB (HAD superfamily)